MPGGQLGMAMAQAAGFGRGLCFVGARKRYQYRNVHIPNSCVDNLRAAQQPYTGAAGQGPSAAQHSTAQHSTAQHSTALHCTAQQAKRAHRGWTPARRSSWPPAARGRTASVAAAAGWRDVAAGAQAADHWAPDA